MNQHYKPSPPERASTGVNTMENERIKTLRAALRAKYGAGCYRITRNDQVHIYGQMPNSTTVGWWLMGDILGAELWLGIHA
jgi:hypothetical protein